MSPEEIRTLEVGQWLTFTPTIWSQPISGQILSVDPEGHLYIVWDDEHRSLIKPDQLHSSKFQLEDTEGTPKR
jgi:hypothetical protein